METIQPWYHYRYILVPLLSNKKSLSGLKTLSTCNSSFFHYIQLKKYFTLFINGRLFFIWSSHFSLNAHSGYLTVIRMVACQWQSLSTQCINLQEQELTKNLCFYSKSMILTVSICYFINYCQSKWNVQSVLFCLIRIVINLLM